MVSHCFWIIFHPKPVELGLSELLAEGWFQIVAGCFSSVDPF